MVFVICMIVAMIPIFASADPAQVSFVLGTSTWTVSRGATRCFSTSTSGGVTEISATATDYNVKITYPSDSTPVIYLKGAYLYQSGFGIRTNVDSITADNIASKTTIIVEKTTTGTVTTGSGDVTADSVIGGIDWKGGELVIEGADGAKLKVTGSTKLVDQAITYKNLNLEIATGTGFSGTPAKITFDGGSATINNSYLGTNLTASDGNQGILVTNNAVVNWTSTNQVIYGASSPNAKLRIESGSLTMRATTAGKNVIQGLFNGHYALELIGGTVEFSTPASGSGYIGMGMYNATNYRNPLGENVYYAVAGADAASATAHSGGSGLGSAYKYFKFEPAYTISVDGGDADVAKAPVGATVTLTPGAAPAGQTFDGWTSDDVTVAENEGVYTFTMPAGNVEVEAEYIYKTTVKILGTEYTFTDSDTVYLKTEAGALVAATDADYNVKLAYDTNNVPTVYLKNADLSDDESVIDTLATGELAIVTEAASTLFYTNDIVDGTADATTSNDKAGAIKTVGKITFSGNALLTLKGNGSAIYGNATTAELVFNNANVVISKVNAAGKSGGWYDNTFGGDYTSITFNGGTATLSSTRFVLLKGTTLTVDDGAVVTVSSGSYTWNAQTLNVKDGSFYLEGNNAAAILRATTITVDEDGVIEVVNTNTGANAAISTVAPTLNSVYAVNGADKATATAYDTTSTAISGAYFKAGKAYTVTVTNGTAQSIGAAAATTKAFVGDEVTLAATPPTADQILTNWEVTAGTAVVNGNTLTMPAGDVTVEANFGYGASITIGSYDYTVVKGGAAMYFKTDADGAVTVTDDESNYNLKFVYANDTDAVPTLYLRNAYAASDIKSNAATLANTIIIVEDTASGKVTTAEGEISADAYLTGAITWSHGDLEIQGPGKVLITKTITTTGKALTFKNADVELKTGTSVGLSGQNITFDGGKFVFEATNSLISDWKATDPNVYTILVKNDASVSVTTENSALVLPYATSASTLTVDSGHLKLASISDAETDGYGKTLRIKDTTITINGGIVEIAGSKSLVYGCTPVLDTTAYTGCYSSYSSSADGTNQKAFETDTITGYYQNAYSIKYVKVAPTYSLTVNGATANFTNKAPVGSEVVLTPERRAGYKFDSWTIDDGSTDYTIADNKFTMPAHNVSITANYVVDPNADTEPDEVVFKFAGTKVTVVRGETYYFITNADGTVTAENATADNYNIKIVYERVKDKTPVIYLRGAYIKGSYGSIINNDYSTLCTDNERASKVTIVVEDELGNATSAVPSTVTADSYLVSYIFLSKGDIEIQGPGKLVIDQAVSGTTTISGNIQAGGDLIFKNADVQMLNGGLKGKNITFDGGKVDTTVTGAAVISVWQNPYTVLVKNDADVSLTSTDKAAMHIVGTDAALQIESGNLVLKSTATGTNSENAALKISGGAKLKMSGGTLEISGTVTVVTGTIDMELTGNFDAVCANNAEGNDAVAYTLLPELRQYNSSWQLKYFKIQPGTGSGNAGGGNTGSHTHSTTKVSGKAASCTADGVKEHYKCSCGKYFEDKAATKEIKDINTWKVIKATGHKDANKDGKCDTCKAAQTSDSSFNALWITLLTVSTLGLCVTFVYNKKMRATK